MRDLPPIEDAYGLIHGLPEVPEELVQWILHRGSKMVLGGGSKTNKTWILTDLAISVACGAPWLGFATNPGRVLFVNLEIQRAFFARRISEICKAKGCEIKPGYLDVWNLRGHAAAYHQLLQQIEDRIKGAK
jgi:RecA-family ATPase